MSVTVKVVFVGGVSERLVCPTLKHARGILAVLSEGRDVVFSNFVVRVDHVLWATIEERK
jgi:hypothetical protein